MLTGQIPSVLHLCIEMQQREERIAYALRCIGRLATLVTNLLKLLLKFFFVQLICHNFFFVQR